MEITNDLIVIIPAYEPDFGLCQYVSELSVYAKAVIVVDDGSGSEYTEIFEKLSETHNLRLITLVKNMGKGYALKKAISYCLEHYSKESVIVTADSDGQHKAEDVLSVYNRAKSNPHALTLGVRDFSLSFVPRRSKLGAGLSRGIYRLLYGIDISDTQTGLRGFSVSLAEDFLSLRGNRFDYEMNMIIYSGKKGVPIVEEPISTVYPIDPKEHVSHFKTYLDSMRIFVAVMSGVNLFLLSTLISTAVDIAIFYVITEIFVKSSTAISTLVAAVSARVISSLLNFFLNYKYVFFGKRKRSIVRYYILAGIQLSTSYFLTLFLSGTLKLNLTLSKVIVDILLGAASYLVQRVWVFSSGERKAISAY